MKLLRFLAMLGLSLGASNAWGHGFELTLNLNGPTPVSISSVSQQPVLDQDGTAAPPSMSGNLFTDQFTYVGTSGGVMQQFTDEGGGNRISPGTGWSAGGNPTMTFNLVSPLYYSDGTAPAAPASAGTYITFSDAADAHPATSGLHATLTGSSITPVAGWQLLSPYDAAPYGDPGHELVKQIYIPGTSTQTAGEYGFAFTMTAHFAGGQTITTGPLVDIFALDSSPATAGFLGSDALQDAATLSIYGKVIPQSLSTPEPASLTLGLIAALGLLRLARRKGRA